MKHYLVILAYSIVASGVKKIPKFSQLLRIAILVVCFFPALGRTHGRTLMTTVLAKNKLNKKLFKYDFVSCEHSDGNYQRLSLSGLNSELAQDFPVSVFTVNSTVDLCAKIKSQFDALPNDETPTKLEVVRTLRRTLDLEGSLCRIFDSYNDDLSAHGFKGTFTYSLQLEDLGEIPRELNETDADKACKAMYEASIVKN